jgi:hypothetical protein
VKIASIKSHLMRVEGGGRLMCRVAGASDVLAEAKTLVEESVDAAAS